MKAFNSGDRASKIFNKYRKGALSISIFDGVSVKTNVRNHNEKFTVEIRDIETWEKLLAMEEEDQIEVSVD